MPRPGPRPYECVRKAWHSDRHPPIRGTLIQEIFRIVNGVHSSTTSKNREWQEKLPIVVLKAEEIMYSKANSEAEYSDRNTLWDRVNDAIDTIIRKDETAETGDFLQPCIEAALHLGCTPRRSSRSQRNENPRCYLKPQSQNPEAASSIYPSSSNPKVSTNYTNSSLINLHSPQHLMQNTISSRLKPDNYSIQNRNQNEKNLPGLLKNSAPSENHLASVQTCPSSNTWSVYPLWYDNQIQPPTNPTNLYSQLKPSDTLGAPLNLPSKASAFISPSNHKHSPDGEDLIECDLTLRLGL